MYRVVFFTALMLLYASAAPNHASAKSIAYADPALGGSASIYVGRLMASLDTTGSIKRKTKLMPPAKPLLDFVAGGGAEFSFNQISEILPDPRLELVGPLPPSKQNYTRVVRFCST